MMPTLVDDVDALLYRAREHDNDAVGALFTGQRARMRRLVSARLDKRLKGRVDVDDVVQDIWAEALGRFREYVKDAALPFPEWLQHIALDCVSHCHRTHIRTKKRSICAEVEGHDDPADAQTLVDRTDDCEASPGVRCGECELFERMKRLLNDLPVADRELLQLRIVEQLPVRNVAAALRITNIAVRLRQIRILSWLRESLSDDPPGDETG